METMILWRKHCELLISMRSRDNCSWGEILLTGLLGLVHHQTDEASRLAVLEVNKEISA